MELEELVIEFKKKNVKAFETLYHMYSDSMSGVIFNIVRDQNVAEEVMQDVFVKAWNNSDTYSAGKGRFFTWLLNIARNAAIDKTRSRAFKDSKKNLDAGLFVDILHAPDQLEKQTDAIGLDKFVAKLAEKCKNIIDALYFKGFTQKETAEMLKIPLGTVKTRNRNCISELRVMMDVNV